MIDLPSLAIGIVGTLVLSVIANIMAPRIEQAWGRTSDRRAARLLEKRRIEEDRVSRFVENPGDVTHLLLSAILGVVLLALEGLALIGVGLLFIAADISSHGPGFLSLIGVLFAVVGGLAFVLMFSTATRASRFGELARRVRSKLAESP